MRGHLGIVASGRHPASSAGPLVGAYLTNVVNITTLTTYSFASVGFGTADVSRVIVVAVSSRKTSPAATLSSVTIGGVSATIVQQVSNSGNTTAVAYAPVPTGTTGTVDVTWSTAVLRCSVGAWGLTGAGVSTTSSTGTGTLSASATVSGLTGGFIVGSAVGTGGTPFTWTNGTERFDTSGGAAWEYTGADSTATGSTTLTAARASSTDLAIVAAAFSPV